MNSEFPETREEVLKGFPATRIFASWSIPHYDIESLLFPDNDRLESQIQRLCFPRTWYACWSKLSRGWWRCVLQTCAAGLPGDENVDGYTAFSLQLVSAAGSAPISWTKLRSCFSVNHQDWAVLRVIEPQSNGLRATRSETRAWRLWCLWSLRSFICVERTCYLGNSEWDVNYCSEGKLYNFWTMFGK